MNYRRHYKLLIDKALNENRVKGETYYEKHHIIPRSEGGDNSKENLVLLTAREHYLAHWLLFREDSTPSRAYAFWRMNTKNNNQSSRGYQEAREAHAKHLSKELKGKERSTELKEKISKANLKKVASGIHPWQGPKSEEWKNQIRITQQRLVEEGKHNFNSKNCKEWAKKRVETGSHHFLKSDFNKKPFQIYCNGELIGEFNSKVEAVKEGLKAGVIDKLRREGSFRVERGSKGVYNKNKLFFFKKDDILEYRSL